VLSKLVLIKDGMRNEILGMKCTFEERPWVSRKRKKLVTKGELVTVGNKDKVSAH